MSTDTRPGGFVGDPVEAFTPPAASGCCGGTAVANTNSSTAPASSGGCCTPAVHQEVVTADTGCCG